MLFVAITNYDEVCPPTKTTTQDFAERGMTYLAGMIFCRYMAPTN